MCHLTHLLLKINNKTLSDTNVELAYELVTIPDMLKFGKGDGVLNYYLYNWRCPTMIPAKIGLVPL